MNSEIRALRWVQHACERIFSSAKDFLHKFARAGQTASLLAKTRETKCFGSLPYHKLKRIQIDIETPEL